MTTPKVHKTDGIDDEQQKAFDDYMFNCQQYFFYWTDDLREFCNLMYWEGQSTLAESLEEYFFDPFSYPQDGFESDNTTLVYIDEIISALEGFSEENQTRGKFLLADTEALRYVTTKEQWIKEMALHCRDAHTAACAASIAGKPNPYLQYASQETLDKTQAVA